MRKLQIGMGIGLIAIALMGCGGRDVEVVYKLQSVQCPENEIVCDCEVLQDPREVETLYGLQEHSLSAYEELSCYDKCEKLRKVARQICEEKFDGNQD